MTGLRLRGIHQAFGPRSVLAGVDLDVAPGTSLAVLGANGSGKTTLLRIAAGLREPDAGEATVDGVPVAVARRHGRIGYIPQHLGLVRNATVLQNASMGALRTWPWWRSLAGRPPPAARDGARQALAAVGLTEHAATLVRDASGGERQRTAIARTLVQRPGVVVADEFVASLDVHKARQALHHLDALKADGCAILASLHNVPAALAWADHVAVLADGRAWGPRPAAQTTEEEVHCILAP
jgi:phosphonate transport system ATP-binding protein